MSDDAIQWPDELFVIDAETTGLDPKRHGLLELAVFHPASRIGMEWSIDPRPCEFESAAIRVNGLTAARLAEHRVTPGACLRELAAWIPSQIGADKRALLCGRNPQFDKSFLDEAARRFLLDEEAAFFELLFHRRVLDTHGALLALAIAHGKPVNADRIDDVYGMIGQAPEAKPHTAHRGAEHCLVGLGLIVDLIRRGVPVKCRACGGDVPRDLCSKCDAELKEGAQ